MRETVLFVCSFNWQWKLSGETHVCKSTNQTITNTVDQLKGRVNTNLEKKMFLTRLAFGCSLSLLCVIGNTNLLSRLFVLRRLHQILKF